MGSGANKPKPKILLVDDDQDFLEVYWEILKTVPNAGEVHTASNGARALALLESESFHLMIVDLNMPKMDGLQVISIARRKYPHLRIIVWTCIADEHFRARAYSLGVDQYWQKPGSEDDRKHFLEAVEAMLNLESQGGFRGIQSKSLVDLIQLECLSQNSTLLRVMNGPLTGKIWIRGGEVIDAETGDQTGESAFRAILGWKAGNFELLTGDESRERGIFSSYHALLLEIAQEFDEITNAQASPAAEDTNTNPLSYLTRFSGVEWVLSVPAGTKHKVHSWGLEAPENVSEWTTRSLKSFAELGDKLQAGPLQQITGLSSSNNVALAGSVRGPLAVGFKTALRSDEVRETMRNILAKWVS
jgi:CheY-like chemotaxis protein